MRRRRLDEAARRARAPGNFLAAAHGDLRGAKDDGKMGRWAGFVTTFSAIINSGKVRLTGYVSGLLAQLIGCFCMFLYCFLYIFFLDYG